MDLLAIYDEQLRTAAEVAGADSVSRLGDLYLARFGSRGFITYARDALVAGLVDEARVLMSDLDEVEWKTRGHDDIPGLHEALLAGGLLPEDVESVMMGESSPLAVDVPLPPGVTIRQVTSTADLRALCAMQDEVFGRPDGHSTGLLRRADGTEHWVAEHGGTMVSAGRVELVPGTAVAGIWGGCTRPEWRGRGIYRALTAARARSASARGHTVIHSDSTEYSRPILERSGLVRVSTTTPYVWRRP